jgi:hypothetical protein
MLYRSTDRLSRAGAPVQNLAHSASFDSCDNGAPSKSEGHGGTNVKDSSSKEGKEGNGAQKRQQKKKR